VRPSPFRFCAPQPIAWFVVRICDPHSPHTFWSALQ